MIKTKTLIFFLIILVTSFYFSKSRTNKIDFNDVLDNQNKTDSDKIIDLQIKLSRQEDQLVSLNKKLKEVVFSFDSLKFFNDSIINHLNFQLDSFRIEQSMLIGPEFSNNIIKLYNRVNILEDRAFFMDSLYFVLVTDMVLIENQMSSILSSIDEIENIDSNITYSNLSESDIDYNYEYKIAHQMYMQGDYDSAISKFRFLLDKNIQNDLADNCQFWIGQILFVQDNYDAAVSEFLRVMKYDDSNKKVDATYKIGLCYLRMNKKSEAIQSFQSIIDYYPNSQYYNKAYEFILNIK